MSFTEKDQKKLEELERKHEVLSDPNVQYHNPSAGGLLSYFVHKGTNRDLQQAKKELAEMRTLKIMHERGLDRHKDADDYYNIRDEEEEKLSI